MSPKTRDSRLGTVGSGRRILILAATALASLGVGSAVMLGSLSWVNGALPLPRPTPTPTVTSRPLPPDAWMGVSTALPVAVATPGSAFAFGQSAQVEVALGAGSTALLEVTVDQPVVASDHDVTALVRATPQLEGMAVFYVPLSVRKVAGHAAAGVDLAPLLVGMSTAGHAMQDLTIIDWRPCSTAPLPQAIDTPDQVVTTCVAVASPQSAPGIGSVVFSQGGGPFDLATGTAITWK